MHKVLSLAHEQRIAELILEGATSCQLWNLGLLSAVLVEVTEEFGSARMRARATLCRQFPSMISTRNAKTKLVRATCKVIVKDCACASVMKRDNRTVM